jgi:sugar fermentation stimulation protein A
MTIDALASRYTVGQYRDRSNRFVMTVRLPGGEDVQAYCPNTSRLIGLLEGNPDVLLTENDDPDRSTNYTIQAFRNNGTWVGIDAARANEIFESYLESDAPEPFVDWGEWEREVTHGSSQLDFHFPNSSPPGWVEVKSLSSCTDDGAAFFSGTPSKRGYRHLEHLGDLAEEGCEARCVFVVQRSDVDRLKEAEVTQEDWMEALRRADDRGVTIMAYRCQFTGLGWKIDRRIQAQL